MSVLSDTGIVRAMVCRDISIAPYDVESVQPASYDIHIGDEFMTYTDHYSSPVDPLKHQVSGVVAYAGLSNAMVINPQQFMLATSIERVELSTMIVSRVEGISSLGRLGLMVHATAGYIDPGFVGQITLELSNLAPYPIVLTPGMRIAQLSFERLSSPSRGYSGRYQNQQGVTGSKYSSRVAYAEKSEVSDKYL